MLSNFRKSYDVRYIEGWLMLMIFKLMGLAPLGTRRSAASKLSTTENAKYKGASMFFVTSRLDAVYNLCLAMIQWLLLCIGTPLIFNYKYPGSSELTILFDFTQSVIANVALFTVWLTFVARTKAWVRLSNRLFTTDETTMMINRGWDDSNDRQFYVCTILANSIMWIVLLITEDLAFGIPFITWCTVIMPAFVLTWFVLQYVFVMKLIGKRYRAINRSLIIDRSKFLTPELSIIIPRELLPEDYNAKKIIAVKQAHTNIYEIAMEISNFYSFPILVTIVFSCYTVIYSAYYLVMQFSVVDPKQNDVVVLVANQVAWISAEILPIVMLTVGVTGVIAEAKKTADVVGRILVDEAITRDHRNALEEFSLALLHRKLNFTACDLFSLDLTLLFSIISTAMTYLVLLIQSQHGGGNKMSNNNSRNFTTNRY